MTRKELVEIYQGYIDCLNHQDWRRLRQFVRADVTYNASAIGIDGYPTSACKEENGKYPSVSHAGVNPF